MPDEELEDWFREELAGLAQAVPAEGRRDDARLETLLTAFAASHEIQKLLGNIATSAEQPAAARLLA